MNWDSYVRISAFNTAVRALLKLLNFPTHNFYALFDNFSHRRMELQRDPDYLILLATLWGPVLHLLGSYGNTFEFSYHSEEIQKLLDNYAHLYPRKYIFLQGELQQINQFDRDTSPSSLVLSGYFEVFHDTLLRQRDLLLAYQSWQCVYAAHQKHMAKETSALYSRLLNDEEPPETEILLSIVRIFLEYVENLMENPKNSSKYKPIHLRVSKYIHALEQEISDMSDSLDADDDIGTIFEHMLVNATRYEPLALIGPAYLYWMFKNRIMKIGNPSTNNPDSINLLLVSSNRTELFPLNTQFLYKKPSIADYARIRMFDKLCLLWDTHHLGSTALSRFLFDRMFPFYMEFMKPNSNRSSDDSNEQSLSDNQQPIVSPSVEFLQNIAPGLSRNFSITKPWFPKGSLIDPVAWAKPSMLLENHFPLTKNRLKTLQVVTRASISINFQDFLPATEYIVLQKEFQRDFKHRFLIDSHEGIGSKPPYEFWDQSRIDFMADTCNKIASYIYNNSGYPIRCESTELKELLAQPFLAEFANFLVDAIFLISLKTLRDSYYERFMAFSKKALFTLYTPEQYNHLDHFGI